MIEFETEREKAIWLACAIDFDGTISHNGTSSFSQNYKELVDIFEELVNALGCRTGRIDVPQYTVSGRTKQYCISVRGTYEEPGREDKLIFLKTIVPFLVRKKKKAMSKIKYLERLIRLAPPKPKYKFVEIMEVGVMYTTSELAKLQGIRRERTWALLDNLRRKGIVVKQQNAPAPSPSFWMLKEVK